MSATHSTSSVGDEACFKHVETYIATSIAGAPIYSLLFSALKLHQAGSGRVVVLLRLEDIHINSKGSLHGSVSATLIDFIGGVAIASHDLRDKTGVSTDMHISFVGGAKAGDTIEVEGRVEKCGGTLAFTTATIRKYEPEKGEGRGALVSIGSHTKYVRS
jgi:acyl-coenzyme A thioesterase 13